MKAILLLPVEGIVLARSVYVLKGIGRKPSCLLEGTCEMQS